MVRQWCGNEILIFFNMGTFKRKILHMPDSGAINFTKAALVALGIQKPGR
jgi:hypothetical protein